MEAQGNTNAHFGRHQADDVPDDYLSALVTQMSNKVKDYDDDPDDRNHKFTTPQKRIRTPVISYASLITPSPENKVNNPYTSNKTDVPTDQTRRAASNLLTKLHTENLELKNKLEGLTEKFERMSTRMETLEATSLITYAEQ